MIIAANYEENVTVRETVLSLLLDGYVLTAKVLTTLPWSAMFTRNSKTYWKCKRKGKA